MTTRSEWWELQEFFDQGYYDLLDLAGIFDETNAQLAGLIDILGVPKHGRILDVPCGFGRFAGPLSRQGYEVVGLDYSEHQLNLARRGNAGPTYLQGDMREPPQGPFDAVINLFSSLGYFADPAEDLRAMRAWHEVLRPGGVVIVDIATIERFAANAALAEANPTVAATIVDPDVQIDWERGFLSGTLRQAGIAKTYQKWLYTVQHVVEMLGEAGFTDVEVFGGFERVAYRPSRRPVFRALRPLCETS